MMRSIIFGFTLVALVGCSRKASKEECDKMLDHYVNLTIEQDEATTLSEAQIAAVREMKKAIRKSEPNYSKVRGRCEREISRSAVDCAMKAQNANEWEACVMD